MAAKRSRNQRLSQDGIRSASPDKVLTVILSILTAVYALLAGLKTLTDYDLWWQLASGRWILEHRQIPSTEIFSYTARGHPWIYPILSGIVFYLVFKIGGYALLSWLGATTCFAIACVLLRRGSLVTAVLLILAIPLLATRVEPRADIFTLLFFAIFASLLCHKRHSADTPIWLLPILMVFWVNLHLGFIAGLGAVAIYTCGEAGEFLRGDFQWNRHPPKLIQASFWLAATFLATLINPWGWGIYRAVLRQNDVLALQDRWIAEWGTTPLTWDSADLAVSLHDPRSAFFVLLLIAILAIVIAARVRRFGVAMLLAGASFFAIRHSRFQALCACVIVILAGDLLSGVMNRVDLARSVRQRLTVALFSVSILVLMIRTSDLITNRAYLRATTTASFGTGLSWWFPKRAAEFIDREKIPGQIFNSYDIGGYFTWRLGPKYLDYIDGRFIPFGPVLFRRQDDLIHRPPGDSEWEKESKMRGIRSILVPLSRYDGLQLFPFLNAFCNDETWVPVYLDEVAAVFVRRGTDTEGLLRKSRVNCSTIHLPAEPPSPDSTQRFNQMANSAAVLLVLGRTAESLAAADAAIAIFPGSGNIHYIRARALASLGRSIEAEDEFRMAVKLEPNEGTWAALAQMYRSEGKRSAAIEAFYRAVAYAPDPHLLYLALANALLEDRRPEEALRALDKAVQSAPSNDTALSSDKSFDLNIAHGRSLSFYALGDISNAISFQKVAVRLAPDRPELWNELAALYRLEGNQLEEQRARVHAGSLNSREPR